MDGGTLAAQRLRRAEAAFASLPQRYLGAEPGFDATYQVRLGDVGRSWEVRARGDRCVVRRSPSREPDVPQVELPQRTNGLIADHIEGVAPAFAPPRPRRRHVRRRLVPRARALRHVRAA